MTEDRWAVFEDGPPPATSVQQRVERMGLELAELTEQKAEIEERIETLSAEIAHYAPDDTDEHVFATERCEVSITCTERWTWDQEQLEAILGKDQESWPEHVKRTISVDKRRFRKLPTDEQERLKPALTRSLNKPKVKVKTHV